MTSSIKPALLAQAIRLVEQTRANVEGVPLTGPEPEWYDGYAEDIATQYDLLAPEQVRTGPSILMKVCTDPTCPQPHYHVVTGHED